MMARRPGVGRRRGAPDTKGEILAAARAEFSEGGYDGATIRGIAARAGVDAALVHHYFGAKEKLFVAAMDVPFEPEEIAQRIVGENTLDGVGERAIRTFLQVWGDPRRRGLMLTLLRSAMSHQASALMLRQFVTHAILRRVVVLMDDFPDAELRAEAMVSQLVGMAMLRYVLKLEPLASASEEELVALIAPVLQSYVDAPATRA